MKAASHAPLKLFTTCPPSSTVLREQYLKNVIDVARWSDEAGCVGFLVYTDNSLVDPWPLSQLIVQNTKQLAPLVAVQPIYFHPYTIAKLIATFAHLHGRRIYLNMLAGGFKNDLTALGDPTPHDERYVRMTEFTRIVFGVLTTTTAFSLDGKYYKVDKLKMTPPLPQELMPGLLMSGSSDAGLQAAVELGATAVQYPQPPDKHRETITTKGVDYGIRIGVIARENADEAWSIAEERFPLDRKGQLTHGLAMKVSDSHWHKQLSELGKASAQGRSPFWLHPFENYKTFCPYLVGDYDTVAKELSGYLALGIQTFIFDMPRDEHDMPTTKRALERAQDLIAR